MRDRWDRPARGTVSMGVPPPATSTATGAPVDFEHDMRGLVERIHDLTEETRRSPEYQRQRDWYQAYHGIDLDTASRQPGFSLGLRVGLLYAQCERETGTAPGGGASDA